MKRAYIRVASIKQSLTVQEEKVRKHNCGKIYKEKLSATKYRPILEELLKDIKKGDVLLITELNRLVASIRDFIRIQDHLEKVGATLEVINLPIMNESQKKFIMHILVVVNEYENNLRRERQAEGIELAKIKGVYKNRGKLKKLRKKKDREGGSDY